MSSSNFKYINKLQSKHILIFGGTSGVGFGIAEASLEHGANITITGSNADRLASIVQKLTATYPDAKNRVDSFLCNLADPVVLEENLIALFDYATKNGKLDHIAFTAGDGLSLGGLDTVTATSIVPGQTVRLIAPLLIAKLIPRYMEASATSSLTLTSGTMSDRPEKGWAVPALVGASIEGLVRGLAVELAPVRVNMVSLGLVETPLTAWTLQGDMKEKFASVMLTKTVGQVEDVAEAYVYFMKDAFVTARTITTDGGRLMKGPQLSG